MDVLVMVGARRRPSRTGTSVIPVALVGSAPSQSFFRTGDLPMLSSYPVACPHANCGWAGNLVPSLLRGGPDAEIVSMHRAWFRCPRCQDDWEVRITNDRVTVLPVIERGA